MKIDLAVIGAGSLLGRHVCKRAVRLGWDVHAFSIYDYMQTGGNYRSKYLYNKQDLWEKSIAWTTNYHYDEDFNALSDEIRNVAGLVYFYEDTPSLKSGKRTFEENVATLSQLAGNWSVRHFIAVESKNHVLNKETEIEIGNTNPHMIISLLRATDVYSYDHFSSCLGVYKNRTMRSIGFDPKPTQSINADTVAKCITTLIHNTNDPNIYRILCDKDMEQYLMEEKVSFDSPDFDYYIDEDNEKEEYIKYGYSDDDDDDEDNGEKEENDAEIK